MADGRLALAQLRKALEPLGLFPQGIAEDGIDEAGLIAEIMPSGEVDGFIHCGMIRHAIELENLVKTEAQQNLRQRLLAAAIGFLIH